MIIEFTGKNSGGVVAVETVRVVVKGRFLQPILYSSCHGTHPVDAELRIEQNPETGMITVNTVLLVNGKDPWP